MAGEIEAAVERKRRHAMADVSSREWHRYVEQDCGISQEDHDNATLADAYLARLDAEREERAPCYESIWSDMPDGWHWCEELEADAPPQLLRSYRPLKCNPEGSTFSVDTDSPRLWQRWTIGGWASVTGRVCPISERPA